MRTLKAAADANMRGFDPQERLEWVAKQFFDAAAQENGRSIASQKRRLDLLDRGARVMRDLMPYRYPRLTSVQVKTDVDLSKLSDAELVFMRRALLKAQGN